MKTVSEYRTAVLTVLGDPGGRRYSEEQIDLALKEALGKLGSFRPNRETVKVKIAQMRGKEAVIKWVPDPSSDVLTVRDESGHWYCAADYRTGGRMYLQLYGDVFAGEGDTLLLEISHPHTIQGLGGETSTTVPESLSLTVAAGAAGSAMRIRARSVTEVFEDTAVGSDKGEEDTERLIEQSEILIGEYLAELGEADFRDAMHLSPWPLRGFPF